MAAGKDEVKLFSLIYSPYAQRVLISLREKGIPFETVTVDYSNKPQELLDANPIWAKIPTLVHNGKAVAESLIILQYIEDAWPERTPLLPKDAFEKSQMRFWADYVYQLFTSLRPNLYVKPGSPEREAAKITLAQGMNVLEEAMVKFSAEGPFFAGKTFGLVDVVMAPMLVVLPMQDANCGLPTPGPDKLPRYYKWCDAMWAHPSVKESLPSKEDFIVVFADTIKKRVAAADAAAARK